MTENANIRKALAKLPNPVAVMAVNDNGEWNGMIASWITQISFDPPLVLVAVHPSRYTHQMIHSAGHFTLNLLAQGQRELVGRFKDKGPQKAKKFSGLHVVEGPNNQPYLPDSAAILHCRLEDVLEAGDHTLFVGRVIEGDITSKEPLSTTRIGKHYSGQS